METTSRVLWLLRVADDDVPVVDDYLAIAIASVIFTSLEAIAVNIFDHHLSWHLVLVNYHLELLFVWVNSLIELLVLHLLGYHLYLMDLRLRHDEAVLLLRLLLLLVLHDLEQLLLSQFLRLVLELVLERYILLLYLRTSRLLEDNVLLRVG